MLTAVLLGPLMAALFAAVASWLLWPDRVGALGRLRRDGSGDRPGDAVSDTALAVELLAATLNGGLAVPGALDAVATACGGSGRDGPGEMTRSLQILAGAAGASARTPHIVAAGPLAPVADAVSFAQATGAPVVPLLLHAAAAVRRRRRDAAVRAAGRLAASLVMPLGLCALPGFLLLGIAPVVVRLVVSLG